MTLKEWLKNNKHVKTVTRDRASAYSSAIQEILLDAMQIADRFHLHQNLLVAVKSTVNSVIPVDVRITIDYGTIETATTAGEPCKKMYCDVDKLLNYNEKSVQLYQAIHEYSEAGYSKRAIAKILHCSRNTVTKYLEGDYDSLCHKNFYSGMDQFYDYIIKELSSGVSRKDVFRSLIQKGYKGGQTGQISIYNGLTAAKEVYGVDDNIECVKKNGSAITSESAKETFVLIDDEGKVTENPSRDHSRIAKAPQSFYLKDILEVQEWAIGNGNTSMIDSCTLMSAYGKKLALIDGPTENIKITTPDDFYMFRAIYDARENQQLM